MNALTKFSIALLLVTATAIAVYLYVAPSDESYDATRPQSVQSQPQDAICKQDAERLERLRAEPSLDEGLRFVSEIRCLQLWPQLQTVMDGLANPSRSKASSGPAGSGTTAGRDNARKTGSRAAGTAPAALDDACRRDEDRLAELEANPSVESAIRFDSELKCPRLQAQLPAVLKRLSGAAASIAAQNRAAPASEALSASELAPSASLPSGMEAASSASDDACQHDEHRLAELQAKPSLDEAIRFQGELKCSELQPQLFALLDGLGHAPQSVGALGSNGTSPNTGSDSASPPPAAPETAQSAWAPNLEKTPHATTSAAETAPPASAPPDPEATSATSDDACKRDEERLAELQAKPSLDEAVRFEGELKCSKLQPQLLAILDGLSRAPEAPPPAASTGPARPESTGEAAPAAPAPPASEPSGTETTFASVPQDAGPEKTATDEAQRASQAATEGERRIAELESEKEALAAKVSQLERDREAPSVDETNSAPPKRPAPAEGFETPPNSQAAKAQRRIAQLESENEALTAEVSQLQYDREAAGAEQTNAAALPLPSAAPQQSETQPAPQAAADAERRIAELENEKQALAAKVSQLEHERQASPAQQAAPVPSPPPAAAERSNSAQAAALASLPGGMPARVLIRYLANNAGARAQAEKLANALTRQGVEVADLRDSASAIRTGLSFAYAPDEAVAQQVARLAGVAAVRRLQPKDGLMVRPGTVELNLSGESHLAAIKAASSRESNHE